MVIIDLKDADSLAVGVRCWVVANARRGAGVGAHTPRRRAAGLSSETSDVVIPHPLGMGLTLRRHRNGLHRARLAARG